MSLSSSKGCKCTDKLDHPKVGRCKHLSEWLKADTDDSQFYVSSFELNKMERDLFIVPVFTLFSFDVLIAEAFTSFDLRKHPTYLLNNQYYFFL